MHNIKTKTTVKDISILFYDSHNIFCSKGFLD